MATGGTVSIKNPLGVSLSVTITGSGTFLKSGGGTASFPETITTDETFTTTSDGPFTLSVKYKNVEIAGSADATVAINLSAGQQYIIQPSPDAGFDFEPKGLESVTTTNINSAAHAINTTGKYLGRLAYNSTTTKIVVAQGSTATSTWISCDAATTYTPS